MLKQLGAYIIKSAFIFAIVFIVFQFSFTDMLYTATVLTFCTTAITFIVFDYPFVINFGNKVATTLETLFNFLSFLFLGSLLYETFSFPLVTASLISALIAAPGEYYFHRFLENHLFERIRQETSPYVNTMATHQFNTEFSQEPDWRELQQLQVKDKDTEKDRTKK